MSLSKIIISLLVLFSFALHAAQETNSTTANEVLQTWFKVNQENMAKEINQHLKSKKWNKGKFFKGEVGELEAALDKLQENEIPQVQIIDNGFQLQAGNQKVIIEFVNILAGKIRINDYPVRLTKGMTYNEIYKVVQRTLKQKKRRTTYLNLFINEAHANPAVLLIPPLIVGGAAAATIDYLGHQVTGALSQVSGDDDLSKYMKGLIKKCEDDSGKSYSKNSQAISQLAALFRKIEEKRQNQSDDDKKESDRVECKAVADQRDFKYESWLGFDIESYLNNGCKQFEKLKKCVRKKSNNWRVNDGHRNDIKESDFADVYEAIEDTYGRDFTK